MTIEEQHLHHGGHSHSQAATFATSTRAGVRALRIGVAGLAATTAIQVALYALSGSVALLGDTVHNGVDIAGTAIVWIAFALTRRDRSERFSFGYHRFEDIAGLVVALFIAASAALVLYESVAALGDQPNIDQPWIVLLAGVVGLAGNEGVALFKIRTGRKIGSAALITDGRHSQADGLSSLGVVAAAAGLMVGIDWLDPVVGVAIGLLIGWTAIQSGRDVLLRLLDSSDPEIRAELIDIAHNVGGVEHINDIRLRQLGRTVHVVANVCMPGAFTLTQAHATAEELREAWLHSLPPGSAADIHVDPFTAGEPSPHRTELDAR